MREMRRAIHFDFHTMPGIDNLLERFDANDFANKLVENNVDYINFVARCNIGFSYYNTKVGKKYPGLKRDILKEVIDACHKNGIGVTVYVNAGLNHELAADHYGWCKIDGEGKIYREDKRDNFFRRMCYNGDYGDHLLKEISEIAEYNVDGIFCDCMQDQECYCPNCMADMRRRGVNVDDLAAVRNYQREVVIEVCHKIKTIVKKDIRFYFNSFSPIPGLHTHAEVECLTSSREWGNDYFYPAVAFARTQFKERLFMSGRFENSWGDFGGIKTLESMRSDLYDALMNGFGLSFGDHLHPVDGLESEVIERIGKVFAEKKLYENYCDGAEVCAEVGILAWNEDYNAPLYLQGAARLLNELKISFNIYPCRGNFGNEKILIIPDDFNENADGLKEKIGEFRKNGGKVIFIGKGVFLADRLGIKDGIEYIELDYADNAYFVDENGGMRWATYYPVALIKKSDGKEFAKYVAPTFNFHYDGRQAYYYRPQGAITEYSAAVTGNTTAYICFDLFKAYGDNFLKEHKLLFEKIINEFLVDRCFYCKGLPSFAIASLTEKDDFKVFHIKAVHPEIRNGRGIIEDFDEIKGGEISVRGEYNVFDLPGEINVNSIKEDGRTLFNTGKVYGYKAFLLKK